MKKAYRGFQDLLNNVTAVLLAVVIAIIFAQVIMRYVFFHSLPWSEELSRYLFVWLIVLGLNLPIRDHMEIRIDALEGFIHNRIVLRALHLFHAIMSLAALGILLYSSRSLVTVGKFSTSASMEIPMYIVYMAIPVGAALGCVQLVINIVKLFSGKPDAQREG